MQYIVRYNLKDDQARSFRQWLLDNAARLAQPQRQGWRYLDTHFTVMGFGDYDCESRWEIDDYAALGSPLNDLGNAVLAEWLDFIDDSEATLLKSAQEVQVLGR